MGSSVTVENVVIVEPFVCGPGGFEHQNETLKRNVENYFKAIGKKISSVVVRVSEKGRFASSIGRPRMITLLDGTQVTVLIIGGEKSSSTHTVGQLGTQAEGTL